MSKEKKINKKDILVGRLLLITCSISKQTSLLFSKTNTHIFKHLTNIENIFKRSNIFVYILTNENYYKVCLNNGLFTKYFKKPHKAQFQTKARQVTKSPWKTMDERGASTFPFHNLPPELKK